MKLLPAPSLDPIVIRVRYYGDNTYIATVPQQGMYRGSSCEQGFDRAAEILVERHFPGSAAPVEISPNDARVAALDIKRDRHDADTKEVRWYAAEVAAAL